MSGTLSCVTARLEVVATNPVARNRAATSVFSGSFGISSSSSPFSGAWLAGRSILTGAPDPFFLLGGVFFASSTSPSDSDSRGDLCNRRWKQKYTLFNTGYSAATLQIQLRRRTGLRIRIDLMRIRIRIRIKHFIKLRIRIPDPDPGFDYLKLKKLYSWKSNF